MSAFDVLFLATLVIPPVVTVGMIAISFVMLARRREPAAGMPAAPGADLKHAA